MKIVLDVYGGDNAPAEIVKGALQALSAQEGFSLVLVGKKEEIESLLKEYGYAGNRVEIVDARDVITNDMAPVMAIRKMKDSSLVKAFGVLTEDEEAAAIVSAGSTGAVLTGAMLLVKRIAGVTRAALAPTLPTVKGGLVTLVDCGANSDCKATQLREFAHLGSAMVTATLGIRNPRVGLLSNGTEDKKGNDLTKEAFALLREDEAINFVGNMEARELLSGDYDVIVSDGFSGNIALKACEGTALAFFSILKENIMAGGIRAKLGYVLLKPVFKKVKKVMDYNNYGGAVLLGLSKVVIKSHGSSKAKTLAASVIQAYNIASSRMIEKISLD